MGSIPALTIVKLGGAAITDKNQEFVAKPNVIAGGMREIKMIHGPKIIVHGAGSFAHNLAKKYLLSNGRSDEIERSEQIRAISLVRNSMQRLHQFILDTAEEIHLNTFSLPISSVMVSEGAYDEKSLYTDTFDQALQKGFVPVTFGDMVFDSTDDEYRVVSGDRIIHLLARHLSKTYDISVIFGSNVDGLFDRDPDEEDAELIAKVDINNIDQYLDMAGSSAGIDVTGGMAGKLQQMIELSKYVKRIALVNLEIEGRLQNVFGDGNVISTIFE